jgi:hypothetical protein
VLQVARSEVSYAKYNSWLEGQIGNYYAKYVRAVAVGWMARGSVC